MMSSASQSILDELLDVESGRMTPWEVGFIEDLNKRRDRALSPKQKDCLDRIWRTVFG